MRALHAWHLQDRNGCSVHAVPPGHLFRRRAKGKLLVLASAGCPPAKNDCPESKLAVMLRCPTAIAAAAVNIQRHVGFSALTRASAAILGSIRMS